MKVNLELQELQRGSTERRKKLVSDRWDVIRRYVDGKSVLDLGCVDHEAGRSVSAEGLHRKIKETASELLGVDYQEEEVEKLRGMGYDVIAANVENLDLNRTFDVVVAGNTIEHLSNPGSFLDSVKRHMRENSYFIVTTDNCFGLRSLRWMFLRDRIEPNKEHVVTFEEAVFRQLLRRHGFDVLEFYYYNGPSTNRIKGWLINLLSHFRKSLAWQMMAVCRKKC